MTTRYPPRAVIHQTKERAVPADVPYQFTEWLQQQLAKRGWTQKQLADQMGWSEAHTSRIVNRDRKVTVDGAARFSQLFRVPLTDVYEIAGHPIPTDEAPPMSTADVVESDRRLTREQKELLLGILRSWVPDA